MHRCAAAGRAYHFLRSGASERRCSIALVCDDPLQAAVLFLKLFQSNDVAYLKAPIFRLPIPQRVGMNAALSANFGRLASRFMFFERFDYLRFREASLHVDLSEGAFASETTISFGPTPRG